MNKTIVIVDDTVSLLNALTFSLRMEGFTVLSFTNVKETLVSLAGRPPDLIMTDLTMPDADGFELIEAIRQQPSLANVPVVIFSARPKHENMPRALALGVERYISKPAGLDLLLQEILDIIN